MENTQHKVTAEWLNKHRTAKGAFTKNQVLALGLKWPPRSGWMQELEGEFISSEQARLFEKGKEVYTPLKTMKYKKVKQSIEKFKPEQLIELKRHIEYLLSRS